MAAELEAFAGHLLVAGGRAVRVPPPGALAETAPRRALRSREGDAFFILLTPAEGGHGSGALVESLAQLAADVYFGTSGGVTAGLREALIAVHTQLQTEPSDGSRVNALALVLRGSEVYAARSGRTFAVLHEDDEQALFPGDRHDPLMMDVPPLGVGVMPDIEMGRYEVRPGAVMLLADAHLIDADDDALDRALSRGDMAAILEEIKALAGPELSASVLQFVARGTPDPAGLAAQPSPRPPREAPPRITPAPAPFYQPAPAAAPEAVAEATPLPERQPQPEPVPVTHTAVVPGPAAPAEESAAAAEVADEAPGVQERMQEALGRVSELATNLTARVQRTPSDADTDEEEAAPAESGPSTLEQARVRARRRWRTALRSVLTALLVVVDGVSDLLDRVLPEPGEDGRQGIPTNVAVGLAVLIPIVIVVVVVGLALAGYDRSEFDTYVERARAAHDEALRLANGACNNLTLRPLWTEVLQLSEQAAKLRPNDPDVLVMHADAQNYLDCYDNVERRDLTLLREYPPNAVLVGPVIHGGMDLYTLDRTNGMIYQDTLNAAGDALITSNDAPIIWRGQVISSGAGTYTVGDLFDIDWLPSGGTAHDNVLIGLDSSGLLVAYSPTFFTTAQQLVTEERWQKPVAITIFRQNLYVLDPGANQIWRYVPPAGERAYSQAPEEYFNGDQLPDLSSAVDLGIDDNGAVYVLFADASIKKYRRNLQGVAEEQPFTYKDQPPGALTSAVSLTVDNDPMSSSLYVVDRANQTVYETSWAGTYHNGFRPRNVEDAFANLQGFYADSVVRDNMYVIAGNQLYHFARNP